jgi:prevent-host-death family protein
MTLTVGTSQMKTQLSRFIGQVNSGRECVLVLRRGKPVAALVSVEDLRRLEATDQPQTTADESAEHPVMKAYGRWAGSDDWDAILEEIYADRLASTGRAIDL